MLVQPPGTPVRCYKALQGSLRHQLFLLSKHRQVTLTRQQQQ